MYARGPRPRLRTTRRVPPPGVGRDATDVRRPGDLMDIARAAAATQRAQRGQELLDGVVDSLFDVGLSLQAALDMPSDLARQHITQALQQLDEAVGKIRDQTFATRGHQVPRGPEPPGGAR